MVKHPNVLRRILEYASNHHEPFLAKEIVYDFLSDKTKWMTPTTNQVASLLTKHGYESFTVGKQRYYQKRKSEMFNKSDTDSV